ncbi:hypothetical protein MKZ38_005740 [Zalerion maritima]|uniref:Uncharacterized protein n=1 Tax=Zalerion maritima TaxID=339359 RepID=A0AAD5RQ84_9PEZI|nr:hypothetical protein MKZ38_005740 [Zalerion maritima]
MIKHVRSAYFNFQRSRLSVAAEPDDRRRLVDGAHELAIACFYFWKPGDPEQKSLDGLLRSILFHILELRLQELTQIDIQSYIASRLNTSPNFTTLSHEDQVGLEAMLYGGAEGIFLWVYLTVNIIDGALENGDGIAALLRKAAAFQATWRPVPVVVQLDCARGPSPASADRCCRPGYLDDPLKVIKMGVTNESAPDTHNQIAALARSKDGILSIGDILGLRFPGREPHFRALIDHPADFVGEAVPKGRGNTITCQDCDGEDWVSDWQAYLDPDDGSRVGEEKFKRLPALVCKGIFHGCFAGLDFVANEDLDEKLKQHPHETLSRLVARPGRLLHKFRWRYNKPSVEVTLGGRSSFVADLQAQGKVIEMIEGNGIRSSKGPGQLN